MKNLRLARLSTTPLLVRLSLTMAMVLLILLALLYGPGAVPSVYADPGTLYVDHASGSDTGNCQDPASPGASIGYALSQAGDGDEIRVAVGTYTENLTIAEVDVTVRGGYVVSGTQWLLSTDETVVDGNDVDRVFYVHSGSNVVLDNLTITGGRATEDQCWGGGVSVSSATLTIRDCRITGNRAICTSGQTGGGAGGGVDANTDQGPPVYLTIEDTVIADNYAGDHGGALNSWQATISLTNVLVINNSYNVLVFNEGSATIVNCTIAENSQQGSAIMDGGSTANVALLNTIVWNSGSMDCGRGDGTCTATYSDIEGGWTGTGNINTDPKFVDPANGDYRLSPGSPCIDTGTPTGAPAADIEGTPRDAAPDMGAYEWTGYRAYLPLALNSHPLQWRDDFNTTTLDANWEWVNENPARWSLTERPGFLRIKSHEGGVDAENLLTLTAPTGDFDVRTRVLFEPTSNFQMAGIVLRSPPDRQMMLGRAYCNLDPPLCVGNGIYFDHAEGGAPVGSNFATSTTKKGEAYLRIVRQGNTYTGYYGEDGINWTIVGIHTALGELPTIGLATANDLAGASLNVDFDFFEIRALP